MIEKITNLWQIWYKKQQITNIEMMGKITDLWQTWDEKQQIYAVAAAAVLILILLIVLLYLPLKMQNNNLNAQLKMQNNITQKLNNAAKKSTNFTTIAPQKIKPLVAKIARQNRLKLALKLEDKQLILNAKSQEFHALNRLLLSLRNQYAIIATHAVIRKTKNGFVDADLKLSFP